jgi:hypothetical protein
MSQSYHTRLPSNTMAQLAALVHRGPWPSSTAAIVEAVNELCRARGIYLPPGACGPKGNPNFVSERPSRHPETLEVSKGDILGQC